MDELQQTAIDALINKIDKAILKHSVSNRDVAAILAFLNDAIKNGNSDKWLRKDIPDIAAEIIKFQKGLTVGDFKAGMLTGQGFGISFDENGNSVGEIDILKVRKEAIFNELVINQVSFILNETVFAGGGCELTKVEDLADSYRCFYDNKNETKYAGIKVDDQARCQRFDKTNQSIIKYYWRKVVGVGENYIDLSITDADGTGIPSQGDNVVQFGNKTDIARQSAIVINPQNGGSVEIYAKIDSYDLIDKNYVGSGVNPQTGEAYHYVYGDVYFGHRNIHDPSATFITKQLREGDTEKRILINADIIVGVNSEGLTNLSEWKSKQKEIDDAAATAQEAKDRIDAAIEVWFLDPIPTLTNEPADEWTTDEIKNTHLKDLYHAKNGKSYQFEVADGVYAWVPVTDPDLKEAMEIASDTKSIIDAMNNDGLFDKLEKQPIKMKWESIFGSASTAGEYGEGSFKKVKTKGDAAGVDTDILVGNLSTLKDLLNALELYTHKDTPFTNTNTRAKMTEVFTSYYSEEIEVLSNITKKAQDAADEVKKSFSDIKYLKSAMGDMTSELTNGVVLGGVIGVKTLKGAEQKITGIINGGSLPDVPLVSIGASGNYTTNEELLESLRTAPFTVDENGVMRAFAGIFAGFIQMPFKTLDEATYQDPTTKRYAVTTSFNLSTKGAWTGNYYIYLDLPADPSFEGTVLTIYDGFVRSKSAPTLSLFGAIYHPDHFGTGVSPKKYSQLTVTAGGLIKLLGVVENGELAWFVIKDATRGLVLSD